MLNDSKSEPFILLKAVLVLVLQLSFQKIALNLYLWVQTTSKQLHGVNNFGMTEQHWLPRNDSNTFVVAPNSGILKTLCNFEQSFWLSKFVLYMK